MTADKGLGDQASLQGAPVFTDDPLLVLHYTAYCNAKCDHCIVDSGPTRKERMSMHLASELIDGSRHVQRLRTVVFTGGESFVYLDDVLKLCARARQQGLMTRVVSNAFWARSPEAAAAMLERLVDEAVDQLAVSFGEFHREHIAVERVRNVFLGARVARRAPLIIYSTVNGNRIEDDQMVRVGQFIWPRTVLNSLRAYGFAPDECIPLSVALERAGELTGDERLRFKREVTHERALINWESLGLGGRAARLLSGRVRLDPIAEHVGPPCSVVGRQITATTGGQVYPCCSVWSNFPEHAMGVATSAADLGTVVDDMRSHPLVRFIHSHGPGPLLVQLRKEGAALPDAYSDICHMCNCLFERYSPAELRKMAVAAQHAIDQNFVDSKPHKPKNVCNA